MLASGNGGIIRSGFLGAGSWEGTLKPSPEGVTSLLNKLAEGDREAAAKLIPLVYEELCNLAARCLRHDRPDQTLRTTALVHEAYLKLSSQRKTKWRNRSQFFAVASQLMRRILVDYARAQQRRKRGGKQQKLSLDEVLLVSPDRTDELLAVNESLSRLEKLDPRQARVVELRYFGGLTEEEAADALGVSRKTVIREWTIAKAWLHGDLKGLHRNDTAAVGEGKGAV